MHTGHVYTIAPGFFGILTHYPRPEVLCRIIDVDTVGEACTLLGADFSGIFVPLTSVDDHKWAQSVLNGRQRSSMRLLTKYP